MKIWQGIAGVPPAIPITLSASEMPGVCSAGRVGGQANQPRPTRTPSPSVKRSGDGASHAVLLGGDACHIVTDIRARPSNCSETLKASGTVLGWRHPTDTMW